MKKSTYFLSTLLGSSLSLVGSTVFVDFNDQNTTTASNQNLFYNTYAAQVGSNSTTPLATMTPILSTNLLDSNGEATGINLSLVTRNSGPGQLRSNNANNHPNGLTHAGTPLFEQFATSDSFWVNNHNSNGNTDASTRSGIFGFTLVFSGLTEPAYNLTVAAGSSNASQNRGGFWRLFAGTVDDPSSRILGAGGNQGVYSFNNVEPDFRGEIILTSETITSMNFQDQFISAASIAVVPEPSAILLLSLNIFLVGNRSRKR